FDHPPRNRSGADGVVWGWLEPPERIALGEPPAASVADADPDAHDEPPNQSGADADLDVYVHVLDDERAHEDLHHERWHEDLDVDLDVDHDHDHDADAPDELPRLGHPRSHSHNLSRAG